MNLDRFTNILGAIVTVALITTIVAHRNSAQVISAAANGFANSIRAAMGK